jgi:hypothetical protein
MGTAIAPGRQNWTAHVRCKDGDHTLELQERELTAERLIRTSRKHSFDPDTDVDWDVVADPDRFYLPPAMVSLYETPLWDRMTHRQRVELSKRELCSILTFGISAELALMGALISHAGSTRYGTAHWAYSLIEVEDECRHSRMFARTVETLGLEPSPVPFWQAPMARFLALIDDPMMVFAGALVVEEYTDSLQRVVMADDALHPLFRQVARIHVIEEARHIRFAREELKRQVVRRSPAWRRLRAAGFARGMRLQLSSVIHPSCYTAVGLDPDLARRVARLSPHRRRTEQWLISKATRFLEEIGYLDGRARDIWTKAGYLPA